MAKRRKPTEIVPSSEAGYGSLLTSISDLLDHARRMSARTVNNILTVTYWEIGRRIVEHEQGGEARAEYGQNLLVSLAKDLTAKHGRGFSKSNLFQMRAFFLGWEIFQTPSGTFEAQAKLPSDVGGGNVILPTSSAISARKRLRRRCLPNRNLRRRPLLLRSPLPLFFPSPGPTTFA